MRWPKSPDFILLIAGLRLARIKKACFFMANVEYYFYFCRIMSEAYKITEQGSVLLVYNMYCPVEHKGQPDHLIFTIILNKAVCFVLK
jgi:hypothetical protein